MSQYQDPMYAQPDDPYGNPPRKTSGMAITALILSIIGLIPCVGVCTAPFGILLGLIGAVTIGGAKKGRGLAVVALVIGLVAGGVQYYMGTWGWNKFVVPVMEGPNDALAAGFNGDTDGFRAATYSPAADASDEEITTFIETLRARYGDLVSVRLNEQAQNQRSQPPMGSPAAAFPYIYEFQNATVYGETEIVFADEVTGEMVFRPSVIMIEDPDLGDITFPPDATIGGTAGVNGDATDEDMDDMEDAPADGDAPAEEDAGEAEGG